MMRKSGEFDLFRCLHRLGPTPFFRDSRARFPTSEAMKDHQKKKRKQVDLLSHRTLPNPNFFLRPPLQKPSHPPLSPHPIDPTSRPINGAYATFISKDDYLPGALVLAYCHHMTRSIYPFIILATSVAASRGLGESLPVSLPKWADSSA